MNTIPVSKTSTKNFPRYVRKAISTRRLCFGGFDKCGNSRPDIGCAIMRNGDLIPFEWGNKNGNLSLMEVKEIRKQEKDAEFIYHGRVYDVAIMASRDNFAKVIKF